MKKNKDIKVKNLDDEIVRAEKELDAFTREISELNQLFHDKKQKLHSLKLKKRKRTKINDIHVTDSAVVAYFEKVCNYDMQKIREAIIPVKLNPDDEYLIDGWYDVGDFEVQVKKGRVVNVDVEYEEDNKHE